jgi:hypothetical protein
MRTVKVAALVSSALSVMLIALVATPASAGSLPTGERVFHRGTLEPAYNAANAGQIGYLLTPMGAPDPVKSNPRSWAPIYLPVYPVGTTVDATLSCMHIPVENCPSHGDGVAGAAQGIEPTVYGDGVLGHDHVLDFPGGDDFNISWEPVLVLFTSKAAANEHLLTDTQILAAKVRGDVILVPLPSLTFTCAVVPAALWNRGTPVV